MSFTHPLLANKVALVTGGGRGIGRSICLTFAEAGASLIVVDKDQSLAEQVAAKVEKRGQQATACVADVTDQEQVDRMAEVALRQMGRVDILVNNVGDARVSGMDPTTSRGQGAWAGAARIPFLETGAAQWDALYHINFRHVLLCCKALVPQMIERAQGGVVINISSVEGFRSCPDITVYSAFKSAVAQFTRSFGIEVAPHKIRVNDIAPDHIETPQTGYSVNIPADLQHLWPYWSPVGRVGQPEDVAGAALFLASDLSAFTVGTTVHVDGGTYAGGGWYRRHDGGWTNRPVKA